MVCELMVWPWPLHALLFSFILFLLLVLSDTTRVELVRTRQDLLAAGVAARRLSSEASAGQDEPPVNSSSTPLAAGLGDAQIFILQLPRNQLSKQRIRRLRSEATLEDLQGLVDVEGINATEFSDQTALLGSSAAQAILQRPVADEGAVLAAQDETAAASTLSKGETACWLGHVKVWQEILASLAPGSWAIVLEDDAPPLSPATREKLRALALPKVLENGVDEKTRLPPLLFLETRQCPYGAGNEHWPRSFTDALQWRQWARALLGHGGFGAMAYALTPETAKVLLEAVSMREPVDIWMQRKSLPVDRICVDDPPFVPIQEHSSEVHNRAA